MTHFRTTVDAGISYDVFFFKCFFFLGFYDTEVSFGLYDASFLSLSIWRRNKLRSLWWELRRVLTKMTCFGETKMMSLAKQLWWRVMTKELARNYAENYRNFQRENLTCNLYFVMHFVTSRWRVLESFNEIIFTRLRPLSNFQLMPGQLWRN